MSDKVELTRNELNALISRAYYAGHEEGVKHERLNNEILAELKAVETKQEARRISISRSELMDAPIDARDVKP